jgi:hypothetical protein
MGAKKNSDAGHQTAYAARYRHSRNQRSSTGNGQVMRIDKHITCPHGYNVQVLRGLSSVLFSIAESEKKIAKRRIDVNLSWERRGLGPFLGMAIRKDSSKDALQLTGDERIGKEIVSAESDGCEIILPVTGARNNDDGNP